MAIDPLHKLSLYQQSVQHPLAEAFFLCRVYEEYNPDKQANTLREDFCGSAAISLGWIMADPDRKAIAVDHDVPTIAFAKEQIEEQLGRSSNNITLICDDVRQPLNKIPPADIIASMNFSTLIFHNRQTLLAYFQQTRRNLDKGGVFVMDLLGGPGAMQVITQNREMQLTDGTPYTYHWQQRSFDALTHRIDCRIHFTLANGEQKRDAFIYDWRLWSIPELLELLTEAGFKQPKVWCDTLAPTGQSDGHYQSITHLPSRHDWVVYLSAQNPT